MPKKKTKSKIKALKTKLNKLAKYLEKERVKFQLHTHKVVYTAYDTASTLKRKLDEIAKVVLVRTDKGLALVVLPASRYVDMAAVKAALKVKKVAIATEKDITKYLKTKVGLLHPFGNLYKIPTLIDRGFSKANKMIAAAGSYTESLEIALKDFENLVKPIKGAFSKAKK
ncbi:MAG: hypothetical protein A2722_02700 [Candidatus Doudnabacteria bacterium RIFCSPHIGHO2_01_FULL_50_11]|uniref:YbaK/aminoacyl-tRNA synthetase-associated domain-containing protein n=1 Tax=Candidatus Doudnabacteria bacterium RIFCSPHIGHO2_01_FULL_50_11 TaxID=1817828 RepID=A0A1F5PLI6_9BACT|nr:MAG: hypothetical protein A2722_02700 [Candidatus Doudnabacteria bacterium RIFCSPHIGHO2_01_FULL_50_11]HLC44591.1 YbaK/EbsC family protein [Patescibacteria group bacterium]